MQQVEVVLRAHEPGEAVLLRDGLGVVDLLAGEVGVADLAHLPVAHEAVESSERLLDRHVGIGPVLLVQIDAVGAEAPQAPFDRFGDPAAAGAGVARVVVDRGDELGGDDDLVAPAGERFAEVLLRAGPAVDVGGVEEVDPGVESGVDDSGAALLVDAHPEVVAAQPDQRDLERPHLSHLHPRQHTQWTDAERRVRICRAAF